ncbi:MAG: hypothetical protein KDD50_10560 [Bdellovibrionales bacterium]|nr:hypothetical protein [Bdellovibrionales bacterium]
MNLSYIQKIVLSLVFILTIVTNSDFSYSEVSVKPYGFLKTSFIGAKNLVNDYKPFYAKSSVTGNAAYDDKAHYQISTKQSRLGFLVEEGSLSGKFELDFDGESGNTRGATASSTGIIRTRVLELIFKINEESKISFGKRWDTFAALNPDTYSVTLVQLNQGNTGFLTESFEYLHHLGNFDFFVQLETFGDVKAYKVSMPVPTVRVEHKLNENQFYGLAYKVGEADSVTSDNTAYKVAFNGLKAYYSAKFSSFKLSAEVYQGSNLGVGVIGASLGKLSSSSVATSFPAGSQKNIGEYGYYVSIKKMFEDWSVFAGFGRAELMSPQDYLSDGDVSTNQASRLGVDKVIQENLSFFVEMTFIETGRFLSASNTSPTESGSLLDAGLFYKF